MIEEALSTSANTQREAEDRLRRDIWMDWRIKRYGYPCLTAREYEAMQWEMHALQPHEGGRQRVVESALQRYVAAAMHVTQSRVSRLLAHAELAMVYFDEHNIEASWQYNDRIGTWRLQAPYFGDVTNLPWSSVIKPYDRGMMIVK